MKSTNVRQITRGLAGWRTVSPTRLRRSPESLNEAGLFRHGRAAGGDRAAQGSISGPFPARARRPGAVCRIELAVRRDDRILLKVGARIPLADQSRIAGNSTTSRIERSPGQHHHQPIDPDPDPAGGRHPVLERLDERLVVGLVSSPASNALSRRCSSGSLSSVNALAISIPLDVGLEALHVPLLRAVALGERRQLDGVIEQQRGLDQRRLDVLGDELVHERGQFSSSGTGRPRARISAASASRSGKRSMSIPACSRIASVSVSAARGRSIPSVAVSCSNRSATSQVVGVRLVPLEHRELGVVGRVDALVAEVLAELVDALQPADDQPLEVQLGRDPQVQRRGRARCGGW